MMGVLGPEGTFSHELAERLFPNQAVLLPTIRQIFEEVEAGRMEGLVPLENSEAGGVGATLDGLLTHRVFITAEAYLEVRHHLAARVPVEQLIRIYVHPQTHEQCSIFLDRLGVELVHTSSNAASAKEMERYPGSGAIVSRFTAAHYGIPLVREDVQNSPGNVTRFVRINGTPGPCPPCTKCSLLIDPHTDRPGLLHDLLGVFSARAINLTRIESRPSKRGMGSYVFFIDFAMAPGWEAAVAFLKEITHVKDLGCYTRQEVPE
ncbi:MAG: ACT domain-containing protein [Methanomicrobiales archaeon]|nr:ACT domain-containing protein [Methanomicrobiales archaeon]